MKKYTIKQDKNGTAYRIAWADGCGEREGCFWTFEAAKDWAEYILSTKSMDYSLD